MMRRDNSYSVLVVSDNEKLNSSMASFLAHEDFSLSVTDSVSSGRRMTGQRDFDIVIINAPLKDEIGIDFAVELTDMYACSVLLLVRNDIFDEINYKVQNYGVFTLSKPFTASALNQTLKMLCSMRERLIRMEQKQKSFEEKLEEIKTVNRAKLILVENLHLTEEQAHKYIEKNAMNDRKSKVSVALRIIEEYKRP